MFAATTQLSRILDHKVKGRKAWDVQVPLFKDESQIFPLQSSMLAFLFIFCQVT